MKQLLKIAILKYSPIVFHSQKDLWSIVGSKLTVDIYVKTAMARVSNITRPIRIFQQLCLDCLRLKSAN